MCQYSLYRIDIANSSPTYRACFDICWHSLLESKSAKLYSNSKVGLRLSGDESFDESESPSKLLEEAHIYLAEEKK